MTELRLPLFPLNTVLFPGGLLPLRIFEPRYLDMISYCFRHESNFGVCLIREGDEVGKAAFTYNVGTIAKITDWHRTQEGLLGIWVLGQQRFHILSRTVLPNQLIEAMIRLIPDEPVQSIPSDYQALVQLLEKIMQQLGAPYEQIPLDFDNASWLSQRLAELLPMPFSQRQYLLELSDPIQRLDMITKILQALDVNY